MLQSSERSITGPYGLTTWVAVEDLEGVTPWSEGSKATDGPGSIEIGAVNECRVLRTNENEMHTLITSMILLLKEDSPRARTGQADCGE